MLQRTLAPFRAEPMRVQLIHQGYLDMVRKRLDMVGKHIIAGSFLRERRTWEVGGVARMLESTSLRTCKMGLHRDLLLLAILVGARVPVRRAA